MVGVVFEEMIEKVVALVADDIPSGGLGAPFAQARLIATRESICVSIYLHTEDVQIHSFHILIFGHVFDSGPIVF